MINTADGDDRDRYGPDDLLDRLDPFWLAGILGFRPEHRAEADVVSAPCLGSQRLFSAVRGYADEFFPAQQLPRRFQRQVFLSEMDAVGADSRRNVRMIVDDEDRPRLPGNGEELETGFVDGPPVRRFIAVLEKPDTRSAGLGQGLLGAGAQALLIKDEAEAVKSAAGGYSTAP